MRWLHFKKFSGKYFLMFGKEEGKHKSENTKPQSRKKNHQYIEYTKVSKPSMSYKFKPNIDHKHSVSNP